MNNRDRILPGFKLLILGLLTTCMIGFASDQTEEYTQLFKVRLIEVLTQKLNFEYEEAFLNAMDLAEDLRDSLRDSDSKRTGYTVASMVLLKKIAEESGELANPEYLEVFSRKTRDERINALMNNLKCDVLLAQGKYSDAKNLSDKMDFITDWKFIGPFRNDTNTGMQIAYPPEMLIPEHKQTVDGSLHKIGWRSLPFKPFMGIIDFESLILPFEESCAYSMALVENISDTERIGVFRLGSTGSVKCFVNGKTIFEKDIDREHRIDQDVFVANFKPGFNIVMFKWGNSRSSVFHGSVRLTKPNGETPEYLQIQKDNGDWWTRFAKAKEIWGQASQNPENIELKSDFTSEFEKSLSDDAESFDYFILALLENHFETHDQNSFKPKLYLDKALAKDPGNSIIAYFNAVLSINEDKNKFERELNNKRKMLLKACELKPSIAAPIVELTKIYEKLKNKFQSEEYLGKAEEAVKTSSVLYDVKLAYYELREWDIEIAKLKAEALNSWNNKKADYFTLQFLLENNISVKSQVAKRLFTEFDAFRFYWQYAETLEISNKSDEAVAIYQEILSMNPYFALPRNLLLRNFVGREKYADALAQAEIFVKQCPGNDSHWQRLGNFHYYLKNIEAAETAWQKALELNPQIAELQQYFKYKNKDEIEYEQRFFANVNELIKKAQNENFSKNYPIEIIYNHDIYNLEPDGRYKHVIYYAKRITNIEGTEIYSEDTPLGFNDGKIYFARVYKKNGEILQAEIEDGWVEYGVLEVGDIIELAAEMTVSNNGVFGDYYGDRYYFTWDVPVKQAQLTYCLPISRKFTMYPEKTVNNADISKNDNLNKVIYNWVYKNIDPLKFEEHMPDYSELVDYLEISTYESWDEFAIWYSNLIKHQLIVTDKIREQVEKLVKNKPSTYEKIKAIYYFVTNKIRYDAEWVFGVHGYKPFTADTILSRQFGDCKDKSILLITMLKVIGIKAYPVMIDLTMRRGIEDVTLAMIGHFNHMISLVEMPDGSEKYLDGTAEFHPFEIIPEYDSNAKVVVIKNQKGVVATTPATKPEENLKKKEIIYEIAEDGSAIAKITQFYNGSWEPYVRKDYEQKSKIKPEIEKYYTSVYPKSEVYDIQFFDVYDMDTTVRYSYKVKIDNFAQKANDELVVNPVIYPSDLMKLARNSYPERKNDLILIPPNMKEVTIEIKYPANYEIVKLLDKAILESEFLDLEYSAEIKQNSVIMNFKKIFKKSRIKASEFRKFVIMAEKYDEIENMKIRFRKKR